MDSVRHTRSGRARNARGFSLHAGVCVTGTDREGLERLCRYVARPAIATERLSELPDGRIAYDLRHPWSDGTTRVVFEPQSFRRVIGGAHPTAARAPGDVPRRAGAGGGRP